VWKECWIGIETLVEGQKSDIPLSRVWSCLTEPLVLALYKPLVRVYGTDTAMLFGQMDYVEVLLLSLV
jgi:hypothetical protein